MIIIEQNAVLNISVTKSGIPVVINHMRVLRRQDDTASVIAFNNSGQKIDEWKAVDVEKVIDKDGTETMINGDNNLLFSTIQDTFFFNLTSGSGGSSTLSIAQYTNTDVVTELHDVTPVEVPLVGTQEFLDADFSQTVANRIRCNFAGRIKVTAVVNTESPSSEPSTTGFLRRPGKINIAINGSLQTVSSNYYNRGIRTDAADQDSYHGSATLTQYLDVVLNDQISIYNTALSQTGNSLTLMLENLFLIERMT